MSRHADENGVRDLKVRGPAGELAGWTLDSGRSDLVPVLFIHPINLQGRCWLEVARDLRPRRRCIMPDLRGHGGSSPGGPYGVDHWAADCVAVMDAVGIDRVHAVGGSLGGPIAVHLAATLPDRIASIVSIGGALAIEGAEVDSVLDVLEEKGMQGMFRDVIPQISVAPGTAPDTIEAILAMANPNDVRTVWEIWKATITSDVTDLADSVNCPSLVVNGELDRTCTPEQGLAMASRLSTSLIKMPGVGHLPMVESPGPLAALVSAHLERSEPAG